MSPRVWSKSVKTRPIEYQGLSLGGGGGVSIPRKETPQKSKCSKKQSLDGGKIAMKAAASIGVCKQGFFENETSDKDPIFFRGYFAQKKVKRLKEEMRKASSMREQLVRVHVIKC